MICEKCGKQYMIGRNKQNCPHRQLCFTEQKLYDTSIERLLRQIGGTERLLRQIGGDIERQKQRLRRIEENIEDLKNKLSEREND